MIRPALHEAQRALRHLERTLLEAGGIQASALWHLTDAINSLTGVSRILVRSKRMDDEPA